MGMNRNAIPKLCSIRASNAVRKSTSRFQRAIPNSATALITRPPIISHRGSTLDTSKPTTGIITMITRPPGESTMPAAVAG